MLPKMFSGQWGKWLLFALGWAALSLLFAPEAYLSFYVRGQPIDWIETFQLTVLNSAVALVFIPGIVYLTRRVPIERRNWRTVLLAHIPACIVFSVGHSGLYWLACHAFHETGGTLFYRFHPNLLTYWAVVGFTQAVDYLRKNQEHERQLARLRLELLKSQLHPHFLFNALHTISAMMHVDVKGADRMIQRLSELLRMTLANLERNEVTLAEELEFLRLYLEVERVRFGERLETHIEIDPDAYDASVPTMFLQPLVENCIRHGFALRQPNGLIEIRARREQQRLTLTVADNGRGLSRAQALREGLGLSNVRKRLRQLYPDDHAFAILPRTPAGTEVVIQIPFHTARDEAPAGETRSDEDRYGHRGRRALGSRPDHLATEL